MHGLTQDRANPPGTDQDAVHDTHHDPAHDTAQIVARAKRALVSTEAWDQARTDDVVQSVGWELYREDNVRRWSEESVAATALGDAADLFTLHRTRVLGTLHDVHGRATVGLVARDRDRGTETWAKPLGVVAVIAPATAPCATVATNVVALLKTRNAVVISPHPSAAVPVRYAVDAIRAALARVDADVDLVQVIGEPSRASNESLMAAADFVIATGGSGTVRRAYLSGTPAVSAGTGNSTVLVDEMADVDRAAHIIGRGAAFNNGTSCSSESNVVVAPHRLAHFLAALVRTGSYVLGAEDTDRLERGLWPGGTMARSLIGRPAVVIARQCGIELPDRPVTTLVATFPSVDADRKLFGEKLSPVLTVAPYSSFQSGLADVASILARSGLGHSCGLYTGTGAIAEAHVASLASAIKACRVMVNQTTMGNAGSFENGLDFTSTVASGTWGGCSMSENVGWRHLFNKTTVSYPIAAATPAPERLFGRYLHPLQ